MLSRSPLPQEIETLAAAGSLGRMEASDASDGDIIIVVKDGTPEDRAQAVYDDVWNRLEGVERPNATGVFSNHATEGQLHSDSVGDPQESSKTLGKRLLLLLESQPLYNDEAYWSLIERIVDQYAKNYVALDSTKEWAFLINDLIRYFRSICVSYQFSFNEQKEKWALRNVKLRHSRLIMYSGLLFLLGEASKERKDKVSWLKRHLRYTPLERIALAYDANGDRSFHRLIGLYDVFQAALNSEVRTKLNVEYAHRYDHPEFARLKANSDALVAELLRFVFARQANEDWSARFFEYLIF